LNYWIKECSGDENLAKEKLYEYQSSHRKKFIDGKTEEEIKIYDRENSSWRKEYWIKRGYTEEEAIDKISKIKSESSLFCKERYIKEGYSEEESIRMSKEYWVKNCTNSNSTTSKESLNLFLPFIEKLEKLNNICVYYGDIENGKKEYFLYDGSDYFFYDLTILYNNIKLIIEYHGCSFHPNKEKLSKKEWKEWRQLFNENKNADDVYSRDEYKRKLAIKNGFKYLTIWSDDNNDFNKTKIEEFLINVGKINS
jgi:hypothetical protein